MDFDGVKAKTARKPAWNIYGTDVKIFPYDFVTLIRNCHDKKS